MDNQIKKLTFIAGIVPPTDRKGPAWWFAFQGNNLLVSEESSSVTIPCLNDFSELGLTDVEPDIILVFSKIVPVMRWRSLRTPLLLQE